MILVDTNQVMISNLMVRMKIDGELSVESARKSIINTLFGIRRAFPTMGEIILCYDARNYWRKDVFPFYKLSRKQERDASDTNWNEIHDVINLLRSEFAENLPYKTMEVDGAESDDIIAVLCKNLHLTEDILIISQDKDFLQLQRYPGVKQYDYPHRAYLESEDPLLALREHIIRGDRSDGIPNVLSGDDTFASGRPQKMMSKQKIANLVTMSEDAFTNHVRLHNWKRNFTLIDFVNIPEQLTKDIMSCYNDQKTSNFGRRQSTMLYLSKHNLEDLI